MSKRIKKSTLLICFLIFTFLISFTLTNKIANFLFGDDGKFSEIGKVSVFAESNLSNNTVTTRELAMFASLSYADFEKLSVKKDTNINKITFKEEKMKTDNDLKNLNTSAVLLGIDLSGEKENTYNYLFYNLASLNEVSDWKIVNYAKIKTCVSSKSALFTAMTFKRGNDIVIAYRGTDFDDIGDWIEDLNYGLIGRSGQEGVTEKYALAVAKKYPKANIYVTGHSLGGYLAQIGGAALIENGYGKNVKQIGYFNGMGLSFWSNINRRFDSSELGKAINELNNYIKNNSNFVQKITNYLDQLKELASNAGINDVQAQKIKTLKNWINTGGNVVLYQIKGDVVSSLGTHTGKKVSFTADSRCIKHHHGNSNWYISQTITKTIFFLIKDFLNEDISKYVDTYKPETLLDYVWITHETDSFFGILPKPIDVKISTPSTIKYNKTANATITVTSYEKLNNPNINLSNITSSHTNRLKITAISKPTMKTSKDSNGQNIYIYTYTLTLKGGIVIGNSTITIGANNFISENNSVLNLNKEVVSGNIKTKLV